MLVKIRACGSVGWFTQRVLIFIGIKRCMRLIGERSGDCGGSLCELLVLMSVPSLQCEELL